MGPSGLRGNRFLIGPLFSKDRESCELFSPKIHIQGQGNFKLLVFHLNKLLITLLVPEDYLYTLSFLKSLEEDLVAEFADVAKTMGA